MTDYQNNDWNELDSGNSGVSPNGVQGSYSPSQIAPIIRAIRGAAKRNYVRSNAIYTTTGTATAYILTYVGAPTAYVKGEIYRAFAHIANTGSATININGIGAKSLLNSRGEALSAGQIAIGDVIEFAYDGTSFRLLSQEKHNPKFTGELISNTAVFSTSVTIAGNTAWHAGNDGSGSGLDSDLLDGQHGTYYRDLANATGTLANARLSGDYSFDTLTLSKALNVGPGTTSVDGTTLISFSNDRPWYVKQRENDSSAALSFENYSGKLIYFSTDETYAGPNVQINAHSADPFIKIKDDRVWHAGNDGSGSGLDADLLDGQQGTYYRDLANSSGTLPNARLSGAYSGITNLSMTGTLTVENGSPSIVLSDTTSGSYNTRIIVDANNWYLQKATGTSWSTFMQFEMDTTNAYANGSQIWTQANHNHLNIGTSASSARSAMGLGGLSLLDLSEIMYNGSSVNNVSFPSGQILAVYMSNFVSRRATASLYLHSNGQSYTNISGGTAISGTWRCMGTMSNDHQLFQKM